jgi:hypothetical protein
MKQQVAWRRRRRVNRSLDRREWFQLLRPFVGTQAIPELAADPGYA